MSRMHDIEQARGKIPLDVDNFGNKFNQGYSFNESNA